VCIGTNINVTIFAIFNNTLNTTSYENKCFSNVTSDIIEYSKKKIDQTCYDNSFLSIIICGSLLCCSLLCAIIIINLVVNFKKLQTRNNNIIIDVPQNEQFENSI
jgi:hypothetical protein